MSQSLAVRTVQRTRSRSLVSAKSSNNWPSGTAGRNSYRRAPYSGTRGEVRADAGVGPRGTRGRVR